MHLVHFVIASLTFVPTPRAATTTRLYVDASAPSGGDGQSWSTAYDDLQDALGEALARLGQNEVGEIWVADGTYIPTTIPFNDPAASFRIVPRASLYGGFAGTETALDERNPTANPTILSGDILGDDGPNFTNRGDNISHVVWAVGQDILNSLIVDGFIITGGNSQQFMGQPTEGAGLYVRAAGPTIRNCHFLSNWSMSGAGGAYFEFGALQHIPRLERCRFEGNFALSGSGAVGVGNLSADAMDIRECVFVSNTTQGYTGAVGGGRLRLLRCSFIGNSAWHDAGALSPDAEGTVVDCVFIGNHAGSFGGAIYTRGNQQVGNSTLIVNCLFAGNSSTYDGGAIYAHESRGAGPTITNCTIVGNSGGRNGGGLFLGDDPNDTATSSRPFVRNSIVWGNDDTSGTGESAQIHLGNGEIYPRIDACDVHGWSGLLPGIGSFAADPLFEDPQGLDNTPWTEDDNYRLSPLSPCVNRGMNVWVPRDRADQDGDGNRLEILPRDFGSRRPRIIGIRVDIGPYELGRNVDPATPFQIGR